MTDTQPTPTPTEHLDQRAPLDTAWPASLVEIQRQGLVNRMDEMYPRLREASEKYKALGEVADRELEQLDEKIPDVGDNPTAVEWITRRAAQVEYDLADARHQLAMAEVWLRRQQINHDLRSMEARVAQIDCLTEVGSHTAGNDTQLEIIELDLLESAADLAHEKVGLEYARRRLELSKRLHREINAGLRAAKRAEERAAKK